MSEYSGDDTNAAIGVGLCLASGAAVAAAASLTFAAGFVVGALLTIVIGSVLRSNRRDW